MALTGSPLTAQVQRLGCSSLLYLLILFSSLFTGSSLGVGHNVKANVEAHDATPPSRMKEHQEELCTVSTLPAIKFVVVAGMGFMAGGALTIRAPLASALLHGL